MIRLIGVLNSSRDAEGGNGASLNPEISSYIKDVSWNLLVYSGMDRDIPWRGKVDPITGHSREVCKCPVNGISMR
jgi:hypothetical protein